MERMNLQESEISRLKKKWKISRKTSFQKSLAKEKQVNERRNYNSCLAQAKEVIWTDISNKRNHKFVLERSNNAVDSTSK
jgi:hypothetical protein